MFLAILLCSEVVAREVAGTSREVTDTKDTKWQNQQVKQQVLSTKIWPYCATNN